MHEPALISMVLVRFDGEAMKPLQKHVDFFTRKLLSEKALRVIHGDFSVYQCF